MSRAQRDYFFLPLCLYALLAGLHLLAIRLDWEEIAFYSKPLLMLSLIIWLCAALSLRNSSFSRYVVLALACSLAGDIALEFYTGSPDTSRYFLLGLGSFLLAHLFYLAAFLGLLAGKNKRAKLRPWLLLPCLLYAAWVNSMILPHLGTDLKIPVVLYSVVISSMLLAALHLDQCLPKGQYRLFLVGALSFVCSDTLLAFRNFLPEYLPIPCPSCWIMATYILAQGAFALAALRYIRGLSSE